MTDYKIITRNTLHICILALFWCGSLHARPANAENSVFEPLRTLYVSAAGSDKSDGLAPGRALRSLGAAAKAVRPGDLVLVGGGTYREQAILQTPGTREKPIVFRAKPGETALITSAIETGEWLPVRSSPGLYSTVCSSGPRVLIDARYGMRYMEAPDLALVEKTPGSFVYDRKTRTLTAHPARDLTPAQVNIVAFGEETDRGFWLKAPFNRVEGFEVAYHGVGIQMNADNTEAWNNTVRHCITGVEILRCTNSAAINNKAFLNDGVGVLISNSRGGTLRGNTTWGNGPKGPLLYSSLGGHAFQLSLYGGSVFDPVVRGNLIIAGASPLERGERVMRYKHAKGTVHTANNVLVGGSGYVDWGDAGAYENNTVLGGNIRTREAINRVLRPGHKDKEHFALTGNLYLKENTNPGFADPGRRDYRLRRDSKYLGQGAWPEPAVIIYVSNNGNDSNDGYSPDTALRSIAEALKKTGRGGTVYVTPGNYSEILAVSAKGSPRTPLELLTYGRGEVFIEGGGKLAHAIALRNAENVIIDGFVFRGFNSAAIKIYESANVTLRDNVFDRGRLAVESEKSAAVDIINNTFLNCVDALQAASTSGRLVLRNNLFAGLSGNLLSADEATLSSIISERNAFAGPLARTQLADWREARAENHPSILADAEPDKQGYTLPSYSSCSSAGLGGGPLGARGEAPESSVIDIADFKAFYIDTNRAVMEWRTPGVFADATLSWQAESGEKHSVQIKQHETFSLLRQSVVSQALTDLTPGTEYRVSLAVSTPDGRSNSAATTITTPLTPGAPTRLYVSPEGDDSNSGTSPEAPLATLNEAIRKSTAGSAVLLAPGVYREMTSLICGGINEDKRFTIRASHPGEAIIDLREFWPSAIVLEKVRHVTLDGLRFTGLVYSANRSAVRLSEVEDIEIVNCIFDGKRGGKARVTGNLIAGNDILKLRVSNNLFQFGFSNIDLLRVDDLVIDHNTFFRGGVTALWLKTKTDARLRVTNNIFYDVIASFKVNPAITITRPTKHLTLSNNLYFMDQAVNMGILGFHWKRDNTPSDWSERAATVEEVRERFGVGQGDLVADPLFQDMYKGDFRLKTGSPAIGMALDGTDAGMLTPPGGL